MKQTRVKDGMSNLRVYSVMSSVMMFTTLPSCVQPSNETEASTPSIVHSSPDVLSLQDYQNEKIAREGRSGGMINGLFYIFTDLLFGSSPDDDDKYSDRRSGKRKRKFLRKNKDEIVQDLESKKD